VAVEWVRLELDLERFDAAGPVFDVPDGVTLTDMAELGDGPTERRRLYELNKTCSADIPDRGAFFSFEEYVAVRLDVPAARPDGQVVALDTAGDMVGLCMLSHLPGRSWAFVEMTGVLRPYRRRGLAGAMKVRGLRAARSWGASTVRTVHHPSNHAIIAANRALGFEDATFDLG
jgi:GNAT superfamily N-acetyltransferase